MTPIQSYLANIQNWTLEQFRQRSYTFAKAHYQYAVHRARLTAPSSPVIIFQMGKVGSSTLRKSLAASGYEAPIYHIHFLTHDLIEAEIRRCKKYLGTPQMYRLKRAWLNQYVRRQIDRGSGTGKWKVITLTRDPVARNLSTFFQHLKAERVGPGQRYRLSSEYYDLELTIHIKDIPQLATLFFERCDHDTPLVFFDRELKGVFGVDVFAEEFPKEIGYKIYKGERAHVLLVRLENLNGAAQDALKEFLGLDRFVIVNKNIGSQKDYGDLYRRFLDTIVLPAAYLDKLYQSRFMQHFYTPDEIKRFELKWRPSDSLKSRKTSQWPISLSS